MDNFFEITLPYRSTEITLPAQLITYAHSYKIEVDIFGTIISYEPDEDGNYRAFDAAAALEEVVDKDLVAAIGNKLFRLFKQ